MVYIVYLGLLALIFGVKTVYWAGTETMLVFKYDVESQWNHLRIFFLFLQETYHITLNTGTLSPYRTCLNP